MRSPAIGVLTQGLLAWSSAETRYFETGDGANLSYRDWGSGSPVVFVHGGQLGAGMWEYQMVPLASQGPRCIAYDRRGCGRSDQPWHGYDPDTLASDLAALLDHLDLREVTLVGHSQGCGDIARFLSRHGGGRIARVALIAPTTPYLLKSPGNPDGIDNGVFEAMIAALAEDRPRFTTALAPAFFGVGLPNVSVSPELMQWGIGLALQASPRAVIEMTRTFSETDFRPDMRAFTMPTLVVHGVDDQTAPFALCGEGTATLIPGSELKAYATGHGLFITEMDRLNHDLLAFIQH